MSISRYIKEIGRGKEGARHLNREQAADLWGQLLDGGVTDLEIGAFCIAMRVKGETMYEMAGFLDATYSRMPQITAAAPVVVIPSYNGTRRLPLLTPLLAALLTRRGLSVLVHGTPTEDRRVEASAVFLELGLPVLNALRPLGAAEAVFVPTGLLSTGLLRLLEVRRVIGLRNPAHALVKLINPVVGKSLLVTSYTHPEYLKSMGETLELLKADAMLLRGTEGESVADLRRFPRTDAYIAGQHSLLQESQSGADTGMEALPVEIDAASTGALTRRILNGAQPIPQSIALQVDQIAGLCARL